MTGLKISTRGDYGIRALIELALHYGEGPLQSGEIAARQAIPEPYLDQILTILRRAGFIRSIRGPQGGHTLAQDPAHLKLSDVILALEGTLSPIDCLDDASVCTRSGGCAQRSVWEAVRDATVQILEQTSIADLAEKETSRSVERYFI